MHVNDVAKLTNCNKYFVINHAYECKYACVNLYQVYRQSINWKKQINKIKLFDASNKLLLIQLLANIFLKYLSCVTDSLR